MPSHDLGLEHLDPGLDVVNDAARPDAPTANATPEQHDWLLSDDRGDGPGPALLVRAQPDRQDELFGWERAGVSPEEYWAKLQVPDRAHEGTSSRRQTSAPTR